MIKTVLAVDDEQDVIRLVQFSLERAGYKVKTALNGRQALALVQEEIPDLIVCDIMMPHMDGMEVVRNLKSDPRTQNIPVIMLTARSGNMDVFDAWQEGAEIYLTKPFNPSELVSFVKRLLPAEEDGEKAS